MSKEELIESIRSLNFSDSITMEVSVSSSAKKEDNLIVNDEQRGIITYTRIAHAFRPNKNNRIWLPQELSNAIPSLTDPYPKAIKPRHTLSDGNDDVPEIGRIIGGTYVSSVQSQVDTSLLDSLTADDPRAHALINEYWKKGVFTDKKYKGVGYILTKGLVMDKDSMEGIRDKRLLTVSIEARGEDVFDNISGRSWIELFDSGEAKYMPGDIVDGVKALLVYKDITIKGYAYTTHPADDLARDVNTEEVYGFNLDKAKRELESVAVIDSVQQPTYKFNSMLYNVMDSLIEEVEQNTIVNDTNSIKDNTSDIIDNNTDNGQPKTEEMMKTEDLLKVINDSEEVKAEIVSALVGDKIAELESIVDSLKAENQATKSVLSAKVKEETEAKVMLSVYKEQVEDSIREKQIVSAAHEETVASEKENLIKVASFLSALLVEDSNQVDLSEKTLSEVKVHVNEIIQAVDVDALRVKIFALGKEPDGTAVENNVEDVKNAKDSTAETAKSYTNAELQFAEIYDKLVRSNKKALAMNQVAMLKREKKVSENFDPIEVLNYIKKRNQ